MATAITFEELLAEWEAQSAKSAEGETTAELQARLGLSEKKVRKALRAWIEQGRVVVSRKHIPTIAGQMTYVPVYKAVKAKKK